MSRNPTTSKKHRDFVSECIHGKSVTKLPGIGETLGSNLQRSGYSKAEDVYLQAQSVNFNKDRFEGWMKSTCGANSKQASDCYKGLKEWDNQFGGHGTTTRGTKVSVKTTVNLH